MHSMFSSLGPVNMKPRKHVLARTLHGRGAVPPVAHHVTMQAIQFKPKTSLELGLFTPLPKTLCIYRLAIPGVT